MNTVLPLFGQLCPDFRFFSSVFAFILFSSSVLFAQPNIQWDKTFGGDKGDHLGAIAQTPDGGYILGGHSTSGISGDKTEDTEYEDLWLLKVAADGTKEWDKTLSMENNSFQFGSLVVTDDGGYIVVGGSGFICWVVKLDEDGDIQWQKSILPAEAGEAGLYFGPIQKTSDGGYLVGMSSASPAGRDKSEDAIESSLDFWIVKLAGDGTKMWDKTIGGVNFDELKSIQQTPDEGYLLGGNSFSDTGAHKSEDSRGSNDYWIVKVDKDGTKVWDKTIGAPDYDNLISANQTTDGGYILAGSSDSNIGGDKTEGTNPRAYWIVKLSPLREVEWDRSLSGLRVEGSDYQCDLTSLIQTSDGGYLAGGYSRSMAGFEKSEDSKSSLDFWIVKLAPDGTKVWDKTIGSTGTDEMASVAETSDGGYILGGSSSGGADGDKSDISQGTDYWIVKLGPDTSLPVTLANFKAQKENTTAYLTWQTTSETRSDRFEVEHSLTGKTWKSIGTVRSKGESSDVVNYQFVHSDPAGGANNMYRLKMVDLDKTFAYSSIKTLKFETAVEFEIYPNPVFDVLKIETNGLKNVSAIGIYNSAGRQVYKSGALVKSEIDLKGLSAGLYVLKIWNKDGSEIAKNIVVGR